RSSDPSDSCTPLGAAGYGRSASVDRNALGGPPGFGGPRGSPAQKAGHFPEGQRKKKKKTMWGPGTGGARGGAGGAQGRGGGGVGPWWCGFHFEQRLGRQRGPLLPPPS